MVPQPIPWVAFSNAWQTLNPKIFFYYPISTYPWCNLGHFLLTLLAGRGGQPSSRHNLLSDSCGENSKVFPWDSFPGLTALAPSDTPCIPEPSALLVQFILLQVWLLPVEGALHHQDSLGCFNTLVVCGLWECQWSHLGWMLLPGAAGLEVDGI